MKGGKHGRRKPALPAGGKGGKGGTGGAPAKKAGAERPRSTAPKKGARKKSFGGSSSADEE